ncbi:MAG: hypothetical protein Q8P64_21405, partial [Deltaproteobacteria bacterium]|nr:hypothetical protein [Deltaproteobacteria bacterium]
MKRKSYIVSVIFILCIGLILMGCPKKTVVKGEPSAKAEVGKIEAEQVAKEKEKEAKEKEVKDKEATRLKEDQAKKEFERSLVAKRTPGIEGEVFES